MNQLELVKMGEDLCACSMSDDEAEGIYAYQVRNRTRTANAMFNAYKTAGV